MIQWGIKIVTIKSEYVGGLNSGCIKTERGFEKWVAIDGYVSSWPSLPAMPFLNINEAFRYKQRHKHNSDNWYYIVEEIVI